MPNQSLQGSTTDDILQFLGCQVKTATLRNLNRLIHAYIRKVPWESVSRIIKRQTITATADCPRWPEEFWSDARQYGLGGTCFESSLAFYSLLISLGYRGYLTVNDMGESQSCHAAIVILIKGQKYLVDITIPVHKAVRFAPDQITRQASLFHNYAIRPVGPNTYHVERSRHPQRYIFTLIDVPVRLPDYCIRVEKDYSPAGFFLDRVVMAKIIDDRTWRFFSDQRPYKLEYFDRDGKYEIFVSNEHLTRALAEKFNLPEEKIWTAFSVIQSPSPN